MERIIEFTDYPLNLVLEKLLVDKTTGKQIIWATDGYSEYGDNYCDRFEITKGALIGINPVLIQPRAFKALEVQQQRTKAKAEVFTPSWIVNRMINHLDEAWFGKSDVFNIEENQTWQTQTEKVEFEKKKWKDYVDQTVLEITCGEAAFIVSRYNASTGEIIPVEDRIGILDRKLRVVTENTDNEEDWLKWAHRAFESVYGYEYQGDSLLIGRINLLMTFVDYYQSVWKKEASKSLLTEIVNIIVWNFWQMDGLSGAVPLGSPQPLHEQMLLFDLEEEEEEYAPLCKVRKWRSKKTVSFVVIDKKEGNEMAKKKWDIVIGNPPYQIETIGNKRNNPVYNEFMEESYKIADLSLLITPARFLFNAGQTPTKWNQKMLDDTHFAVLDYFEKSDTVFRDVDIKGGVAIHVYNHNKEFGPIRTFAPNPNLRNVVKKVSGKDFYGLDSIVSNRGMNRFSSLFMEFNENLRNSQSGTGNMIAPNVFEKTPEAFTSASGVGKYSIMGRQNNKRVKKGNPK